jgi:hypothetical protein
MIARAQARVSLRVPGVDACLLALRVALLSPSETQLNDANTTRVDWLLGLDSNQQPSG